MGKLHPRGFGEFFLKTHFRHFQLKSEGPPGGAPLAGFPRNGDKKLSDQLFIQTILKRWLFYYEKINAAN
jgi:hypothetical protein